MSDVCYPQRFYLETRNFYDTKDILFINSLGGVETIRLRGEIDANAEYTRISADKISTPEYFTNGILDAETENVFSSEQETFTGDTGFMPKENLDRLRDLFNNKMVFEIKNNRLVPVTVSMKSAQWYTNKQSLYSISLQWQYAFTNEYYSPAGLIAATGTCPAVETFAAVQSGRDKVTITWALETGYNKIKIEIISSGVSSFYTIEGNNGQQEIAFDNPATDLTGANIQVKGSTICNDLIDPADVGATTTITFRVYPNKAPTAVNDIFYLDAGYNTAQVLKGSVLDNDYDENGDDFKAVAASGATGAGGTYAIDEAGIVTYTPPSDTYTGTDSFSYSITEIGTGALTGSATVYINVVASAASSLIVYVKLVFRNKTLKFAHDVLHYYGEVWMEFYSDAAGTAPMDVTGIGLNILIRKTMHDHGDTYTDTSYAATGFEMKFFDGEYHAKSQWNYSVNWTITWDILPGSGYKGI